MRIKPRSIFVTLSLVTLAAGCKTRSNNESFTANSAGGAAAAENAAFESATREAAAFQKMNTSQANGLISAINPDVSKLRGSWEFTLFPKVSSMSDRSSMANMVDYGRPREFQFTIQRNDTCKKLYDGLTNTKWNQVFFADVKDETNLRCFIVSAVLKGTTVANRAMGDTAEVRMYFDARYRAHGIDVDSYAADRRTVTTEHIPFDTKESISSGLGSYPIDLPNLTAIFALGAERARDTSTTKGPLTMPKDAYITRKLSRSAPQLCSNGYMIKYRDYYGSKLSAGWCQGEAWPMMLETGRYFAVLTRKP